MISRFFVAIGLCFLFLACKKDDVIEKNAAEQLMTVVVEKNVQQEYTQFVNFTARVVNDDLLTVVSQVSAEVGKIFYSSGDEVKEGDLIIELGMQTALNNLEKSRISFAEKKLRYETELELYKRDLSSKSGLKLLELEMQSAKTVLNDAESELDKRKIYSPHNGVIDDIFIHEGEFVNTSQKLFNVFNKNKLRIVFQVPEKDYQNIHKGMPVMDSNKNGILGKIDFVSNVADSTSRTYKVESLVFDDKNYKIGMPLDIFVEVGKISAYQIPSSSIVIDDDGEIGIRIVNTNDNKVLFLKIDELIEQDDENLVVSIKDLQEGIFDFDLIVVGQNFVKNDKEVLVQYNKDES